MNLRETYDAIAGRWHEAARSAAKHRPGLEVLVRDVSSGARVLDVGCGTGLVAQRLALAGMHVTGSIFRRGCSKSRDENVQKVSSFRWI